MVAGKAERQGAATDQNKVSLKGLPYSSKPENNALRGKSDEGKWSYSDTNSTSVYDPPSKRKIAPDALRGKSDKGSVLAK